MENYKITLYKILNHLKTILIHKKYVFIYACKCGIPIQGIIHDLSKFSPSEFLINVKYYENGRSPIDVQKEIFGYSPAWSHHKGHNPHHYEYWTDRFDEFGYVNKIPFKYSVEMICDNIAANKTYMKDKASFQSLWSWWTKKRDSAMMHPTNKLFLDSVFNKLKEYEISGINNEDILNIKRLKEIYNLFDKMYPNYQIKFDDIKEDPICANMVSELFIRDNIIKIINYLSGKYSRLISSKNNELVESLRAYGFIVDPNAGYYIK